ncbi:MAG: PilT/PilU family type 4a pilus ATPase [Cyanobacteriota bacterium]|nr:PilT/PilU family type 4a pilus ATPase [Cyanobacteriota bacterium]
MNAALANGIKGKSFPEILPDPRLTFSRHDMSNTNSPFSDSEWVPPAPPTMQRPRPMAPAEPPTQVDPTLGGYPPSPMMDRTMADPMSRSGQSITGIGPITGIGTPARPPIAGLAPAPPQAPIPPGGIPFAPPGRASAPAASQGRVAAQPRANHITLRQLVQEAFDNGYSDIHLGVGEVPRFRDRGQMLLTSYPVTTMEIYYDWLRESLPESQIRQFEETMELDTAVQYEGLVRCRVNCFVSLLGPAMVMRLIPIKILSLEQLRCPEIFKVISREHKGLVLVTGPTGSGKSTTMAAMVDFINTNDPKHIISIEDPVEFVHQSKKSMIRQREVGIHTLEFANALKASLREDPDVILIGEMRDRETVDTAIKAAQTGHLVFGTLHTNSAVKTIERLLGIYRPEEQEPMRMQLAETLVGIIAQTLVRTTDGKRCAAHEIMRNTDAIRDYIKRGAVDEIEELIMADSFEGMQTMNQSLFNLYQEGRITEEVCLDAAPRQNEMAQWLRGRI